MYVKFWNYVCFSGILNISVFTLVHEYEYHLNKVCQWLATGRWFYSGYPSFLHQYSWPPWYSWNIVECGVKHHNANTMTCFQENLLTLKSMHIPFLVYIKKLQNLSADIEYAHSSIFYDRPVHLNLTSNIRIQQTSPHIKKQQISPHIKIQTSPHIKIQQTSPHIKIHLTLILRYNKPLLTPRYTSPLH